MAVGPQPGRAKAMTESMRTQTTELCRQVREMLRKPASGTARTSETDSVDVIAEGEDGVIREVVSDHGATDAKTWMAQAYAAWDYGRRRPKGDFGAWSFATLALGSYLGALKVLTAQ